jgi:hypothetical protein
MNEPNLPWFKPQTELFINAIERAAPERKAAALFYLAGVLDVRRPGEIDTDRLRADLILQLLPLHEHPNPKQP